MAPEQALDEPLDDRSDIFSLGSTFFHVFTGRLPFAKSPPQTVLLQITQEDAPRLSEAAPHLPRPLSVIIGRIMARPPEERYQDVGVILEDLASYERRLLLRCADSSPTANPTLGGWGDAEGATQVYQFPEAPDDVVI